MVQLVQVISIGSFFGSIALLQVKLSFIFLIKNNGVRRGHEGPPYPSIWPCSWSAIGFSDQENGTCKNIYYL